MVLQLSGPISMQDVATEFDVAAPFTMTGLRDAAGLSGTPIALTDFYGLSAVIPVVSIRYFAIGGGGGGRGGSGIQGSPTSGTDGNVGGSTTLVSTTLGTITAVGGSAGVGNTGNDGGAGIGFAVFNEAPNTQLGGNGAAVNDISGGDGDGGDGNPGSAPGGAGSGGEGGFFKGSGAQGGGGGGAATQITPVTLDIPQGEVITITIGLGGTGGAGGTGGQNGGDGANGGPGRVVIIKGGVSTTFDIADSPATFTV